MSLLIVSFLAGMLSVLAPCVLPVLPIILGSSLGVKKRYRPLVIILSTGFFITFFTVLLKVSSSLVAIPQSFRTGLSTTIIILYGLTLIRPALRERVAAGMGLHNANKLASDAKKQGGLLGDILLGASLGPIFASCSPTYAILLSVVFPKSFALGLTYTLVYSLGFAVLLSVFAYGGRAIIQKFSRASSPNGLFKKILGVILVLTGILIATGVMTQLQTAFLAGGSWDATRVEQALLGGIFSAPKATGTNSAEASKYLNTNYAAPEISGLTNRINGGPYNSIHDLSGKVVLIDFRTYSCINCIRTLPYLKARDAKYASQGLVIIGVHSPEFQFEKDPKNVANAVEQYGLHYLVAQDNSFATRNNYGNQYRPAKYLIDKQGKVRYTHFGEGNDAETEHAIQYLLGDTIDTGLVSTDIPDATAQSDYRQSPETYFGSDRGDPDHVSASTDPNHRWLSGERNDLGQYQELASDSGSLRMNVYASKVNLVAGVSGSVPVEAEIYLDGVLVNTLYIKDNTLYTLRQGLKYESHRIEVRFKGKGVDAYTFTFG